MDRQRILDTLLIGGVRENEVIIKQSGTDGEWHIRPSRRVTRTLTEIAVALATLHPIIEFGRVTIDHFTLLGEDGR